MESLFSKALEEFLKDRMTLSSGKNSPKDPEDIFIKTLNGDDLESINLPKYLAPPIGRGLPKRYLQTNPSIHQVKASFCDVFLMRRLRMAKAIFFLYQQKKSPKRSKIAIFTWIIADGVGDYYAQQEAANVLLDKFPDLYLISMLHKDAKVPALHRKCPHYLLRYTGKLNHPIIYEAFSDELLAKLSQTDLILEFPTAFPDMVQLLEILRKNNPSLRHQRIGEHSLIESLDFTPSTGAYCMGLHALELGIFSKKNSFGKHSILGLQYQPLFKLLITGRTQEAMESYLHSHTFNVSYTKTFRGTYLYLHMLCKGLMDHPKDIDLCFFNLDLMLRVLRERFQKEESYPLWEQCKIGKVFIYIQTHVIPIVVSSAPKTLRMIHCPALAQDDLHRLFCFTEHLIGCTGDQTLCEAICSGTPFFYDPPPFKKAILKDLLFLAKSRIPQYPFLEHLFTLLLKNPHVMLEAADGEWISEDYMQSENDRLSLDEDSDEKIGDALASLLSDPSFKKGFLQLRDIIHREHSFDPMLEGIINRILFHKHFPALMHWEQGALSEIGKGELSAINFLILLREKLVNLSNLDFVNSIN
jgi:hypothetical protein